MSAQMVRPHLGARITRQGLRLSAHSPLILSISLSEIGMSTAKAEDISMIALPIATLESAQTEIYQVQLTCSSASTHLTLYSPRTSLLSNLID